jgi:hypothetical protein
LTFVDEYIQPRIAWKIFNRLVHIVFLGETHNAPSQTFINVQSLRKREGMVLFGATCLDKCQQRALQCLHGSLAFF